MLVVHRPRYDDWTFPKGKDEPDETSQAAALREVEEETGLRCRILSQLPQTNYQLSTGEGKCVQWFVMRPIAGQFIPNSEVDEVVWTTPAKAGRLLSYERDRQLVNQVSVGDFLTTGTFHLLRHGAAGSRFDWEGDDFNRPLTEKGHRQAAVVAERLATRGVDRIVSSPYVRCRQTVQPLADLTELPVDVVPELSEAGDPKAALRYLETLVGYEVVVSSHGDIIPAVLDRLVRRGMSLESPFDCRKASTWEVSVEAGTFTKARYVPPPEV